MNASLCISAGALARPSHLANWTLLSHTRYTRLHQPPRCRANRRFEAGPGVGDRLDHRGYHKATIPLTCPYEAHGVEEAGRTSSTRLLRLAEVERLLSAMKEIWFQGPETPRSGRMVTRVVRYAA